MSKIQKTDHFYLIDGSGYIFRAYYALPPLTRKSDGLPTGAVSGFCSMLFKLLEDSKSKENKQKPTPKQKCPAKLSPCRSASAATKSEWNSGSSYARNMVDVFGFFFNCFCSFH